MNILDYLNCSNNITYKIFLNRFLLPYIKFDYRIKYLCIICTHAHYYNYDTQLLLLNFKVNYSVNNSVRINIGQFCLK